MTDEKNEKKHCKVCSCVVGEVCAEVGESDELVVVDEDIPMAYILNEGDRLCLKCSNSVTYYRRVK